MVTEPMWLELLRQKTNGNPSYCSSHRFCN
jgi:hypothetical protein